VAKSQQSKVPACIYPVAALRSSIHLERKIMQSEDELRGYVTTYRAVAGRSHAELADVLGFAPGTLSNGYRVYQLSEPVGPGDFAWKDRTRYSAGWHFDPAIGEYVQRADELRAHLGKRHGYDEGQVDRELAAFQVQQVQKLNVRSGPDRIVKVVPTQAGSDYPDSGFRNIPQWVLKNRKKFVFIGTSV
jgi:hypothetical protein